MFFSLLLERSDGDVADGRTGVPAGAGPTHTELGFVLGGLDDAYNPLGSQSSQERGQAVAAHCHNVGREEDLNMGVIPLGVYKPKPGEHVRAAAQLNYQRHWLCAVFSGKLPVFRS